MFFCKTRDSENIDKSNEFSPTQARTLRQRFCFIDFFVCAVSLIMNPDHSIFFL